MRSVCASLECGEAPLMKDGDCWLRVTHKLVVTKRVGERRADEGRPGIMAAQRMGAQSEALLVRSLSLTYF